MMRIRYPNALWIQGGGRDFIVCVEQDDDGGRTLLRACFVDREEECNCDDAFIFMREDGRCFAVSNHECAEVMEAIAGILNTDEWEDTVGMVFGTVGVEMKTVDFESDVGSKLMLKWQRTVTRSMPFHF